MRPKKDEGKALCVLREAKDNTDEIKEIDKRTCSRSTMNPTLYHVNGDTARKATFMPPRAMVQFSCVSLNFL